MVPLAAPRRPANGSQRLAGRTRTLDRDGLLMAVVDKGFAELTTALRELPLADENLRDRTEFIVNAAWEAFSSPTSMAAMEILIATRAMRDSGASEHLAAIGATMAKLGKHIGE